MPDIQIQPYQAGGDDWWKSAPLAPSAQPVPQAQSPFAGAISKVESGGNYRAIGPDTGGGNRALGKYQVMASNVGPWSQEVLGRQVTPQEFLATPELQDQIFNAKFSGYVDKYGPEGAARAWFAGEGGMNKPDRKDVLGTSVSDYSRKFMNAMGPGTAQAAPQQPVASQPTAQDDSWWQSAPLAKPTNQQAPQQAPQAQSQTPFDARFTGAAPSPPTDPALAPALNVAAEMTRGEPVSPGTSIAIDFQNQGSAAGQRTSPNVALQGRNLVSADVFQSDSGELLFRDPASGEVVTTEQNKHVVLRDPSDNTLKVFARTEDTNEGVLSSAGRLLGTGMGAGAPTARPGVGLRPPVKPGSVVSTAANRLGVQIPRAVTTDSTAVQRAAATARNVPFAGDPLVKATERAVTQLGSKAGEIAQGYGGGTTAGAGEAAKSAIARYITGTTKARSKKLYDAVDNLVNNNVKTRLSNTSAIYDQISAERSAAALPSGKAQTMIEDAIGRDGLTYQGIKKLRTYLGEMLDNGILPEGLSGAELKQIYGALSDDLAASVKASGGPKAAAAFERANRYYKLVSDRRAALAKIVGMDGNAPAEAVFSRIATMAGSTSRADIAKLLQARKAIGADDWNEFVSGIVSSMGRNPTVRGAPESLQVSDFSPERFLTAYSKMSKEGRSILFRSAGNENLASSLDDIATISTRFKELQKFSNPSGTAQNVSGVGIGAALMTAPLTTITSVIGGRALATALSKPASVAAIADWSKKYERAARHPQIANVALLTLASRNLSNTLKDNGTYVTVDQFLRAIQSPAKSRADTDQQEIPRPPGQ